MNHNNCNDRDTLFKPCDCIIGYITTSLELVHIYNSDDSEVKTLIEISNDYCPKCGEEVENEI